MDQYVVYCLWVKTANMTVRVIQGYSKNDSNEIMKIAW